MKKTRILFEAGPMVDSKKTGVGYFINRLIASLGEHYGSELSLDGYYFDFLSRKHKRAPQLVGVRFRKLWIVPGKLLSLCRRFGFQPFLDYFTSAKADVIFFTNYVALPTISKRQKVALAVYDLSFLDHPEYAQSVNLHFMRRFCAPSIKRADVIVTISEFTKSRLEYHFPGLRAKVVVTPIPPMALSGRPQPLSDNLEQLGVQAGKYILYLGTIEPRKNLQGLVKAYAALPVTIRDSYSLVLAGGKGWKDEAILDEIREMHTQGLNIIQTGYISDSEKASLYSQAACFVLPSHYEGFGMPILEAMQYHVPTAISDIPVFHEVAHDAAAYFDKDDARDMANVLAHVLSDGGYREALVRRANEHLQSFSWDSNAQIIYEAFRELSPRERQ